MFGRSLIQALAAVLVAGFLSSGSCSYESCSGDCEHHDHHGETGYAANPDRIQAYRMKARGLPPGDVTWLLTRIHGPWLLPEERVEARLRAAFAGRVLAANRELLGLSPDATLAFDAHTAGEDLLLEIHARDVTRPSRITLRIEPTGRLSRVRVDRPGW